MRVLAVAKVADLLVGEPDEDRQRSSSPPAPLLGEPATRRPRRRRRCARRPRRPTSVTCLARQPAFAIDLGEHAVVARRVDHDRDRLEVLRGRTHHGRAADVDVLDHVVGARRRSRRSRGTDRARRPAGRTARCRTRRAGATCSGLRRSASSPPWIAGCSVLTRPPSISGEPVTCLDRRDGDARVGQHARGAAGSDQLHAPLDQRRRERHQPGLVVWRQQRAAHRLSRPLIGTLSRDRDAPTLHARRPSTSARTAAGSSRCSISRILDSSESQSSSVAHLDRFLQHDRAGVDPFVDQEARSPR